MYPLYSCWLQMFLKNFYFYLICHCRIKVINFLKNQKPNSPQIFEHSIWNALSMYCWQPINCYYLTDVLSVPDAFWRAFKKREKPEQLPMRQIKMLAYSFLHALQTSTLLEQNSYEPVKWGLNTFLTVYIPVISGVPYGWGKRSVVGW